MTLVNCEKKGHLVTVTLNRPEKLNALNHDMLEELRKAWVRYADDEDAWVAILAGAGKSFCAGLDKSWFAEAQKGYDYLGQFLSAIERDPFWSGQLEKPVIAAVKGYAIGGGLDLILKCDLRVAGESAKFQQPEVERGNIVIFYDDLPSAIATEMLAGFVIPARRAYDVGMINRVVPDAQVLDAAIEMADALLSRPPLVLHQALKIQRDLKNTATIVPRQMLNRYTASLSKELVHTEDWKESTAALLENKRPNFMRR
jgi:enoyl-CoA hydratase/carnithine racemase